MPPDNGLHGESQTWKRREARWIKSKVTVTVQVKSSQACAECSKETQARNPIDINKLVFTVLAIVRHELQKHRVELRTELDKSLPTLEGDRVQLQQVVLNLVINAIEAMQSVAPRILSIRSGVSKPNIVHVTVEDTGTGVDPSNHDHIFNPMFTTKERGMGIGLSICHSIIESHNGRIWATRGIDKGSIFQFELPTPDASLAHVRYAPKATMSPQKASRR